jgi:hypothetical protein
LFSDFNTTVSRSIGKIFIREINAINLPFTSIQKHGLGNNCYCIIEMNHCQRQTTPVLCDTSNFQWNVSFRFFIGDIKQDIIKCFVYNRSKYTTDRKIIAFLFFLIINEDKSFQVFLVQLKFQ